MRRLRGRRGENMRSILLGDPRWLTHCQACGRTQNDPPEGAQARFCYSSGQYHGGTCYDTLFGICESCGEKNMSVVINSKPENHIRHPEWAAPLCDDCHWRLHMHDPD